MSRARVIERAQDTGLFQTRTFWAFPARVRSTLRAKYGVACGREGLERSRALNHRSLINADGRPVAPRYVLTSFSLLECIPFGGTG